MTERSRFWNGTSVGDATEASYDAPTEFAQVLMGVGGSAGQTNRGRVIASLAATGALAVTTPGANTARVATGEALVYGSWYQNDANVDVNIPTPAGATRIDLIVLRKSWAAQTIRVTRIPGAEGGAAPALVQSIGTTWDFPLAQVSITTGGVMTFTDQRKGITRSVGLQFQTGNGLVVVEDPNALNRPVLRLIDSATRQAYGIMPLPKTWISGTKFVIRYRYFMHTATAGNVRLEATFGNMPVSGAPTLSTSSTITDAVPGVAGDIKQVEAEYSLAFAATDWLYFRVARLAAEGVDTASGDLNLMALAEIEYEASA